MSHYFWWINILYNLPTLQKRQPFQFFDDGQQKSFRTLRQVLFVLHTYMPFENKTNVRSYTLCDKSPEYPNIRPKNAYYCWMVPLKWQKNRVRSHIWLCWCVLFNADRMPTIEKKRLKFVFVDCWMEKIRKESAKNSDQIPLKRKISKLDFFFRKSFGKSKKAFFQCTEKIF